MDENTKRIMSLNGININLGDGNLIDPTDIKDCKRYACIYADGDILYFTGSSKKEMQEMVEAENYEAEYEAFYLHDLGKGFANLPEEPTAQGK